MNPDNKFVKSTYAKIIINMPLRHINQYSISIENMRIGIFSQFY